MLLLSYLRTSSSPSGSIIRVVRPAGEDREEARERNLGGIRSSTARNVFVSRFRPDAHDLFPVRRGKTRHFEKRVVLVYSGVACFSHSLVTFSELVV